jgi:hypothetical protein
MSDQHEDLFLLRRDYPVPRHYKRRIFREFAQPCSNAWPSLVLAMRFTFLFALLPLLASVAVTGSSNRGLEIRVVKEKSKRGSNDGVVRRAEKSVVTTYVQCEQVCVSLVIKGTVRQL